MSVIVGSVETVTLFFALLTGLAMLTTVLIVVSAAVGDRLGMLATLRPVAVELAAAVTITCMAGSLYLSEVAGFEPCRLCWIQRFFMYPAAALLVIAVVNKQRWPTVAAGILAVAGLAVSIFHRIEQASGGFGSVCDPTTPCSSRWVNHFGFVTIPTMAGVGFVTAIALIGLALSSKAYADSTTKDRS